MNPNNSALPTTEIFGLQYPRSLGTYQTSAEAQTVVDRLSDAEFPVQKIRIVGTDLRQVERVTGRLTWTRVLLGGLVQGLMLGLFIGLLFAIFSVAPFAQILVALGIGALFGIVMAAISYGMTGGQKDYSSVTAIVPMKYEILTEHNVVDQALGILREAGRPEVPQPAPATGPAPYSGQGPSYGQPSPQQSPPPPANGPSRPSNAPTYGQPAPQPQPQQDPQPSQYGQSQNRQGQYGQPGPQQNAPQQSAEEQPHDPYGSEQQGRDNRPPQG